MGLIQEVEDEGGMTQAIEQGLPKLRIEEAAARKQGRIDTGRDVVVGVNRFQRDTEEPIDTLEVDNEAVRRQQVQRLEELRKRREMMLRCRPPSMRSAKRRSPAKAICWPVRCRPPATAPPLAKSHRPSKMCMDATRQRRRP